jgi:hypothetical protein
MLLHDGVTCAGGPFARYASVVVKRQLRARLNVAARNEKNEFVCFTVAANHAGPMAS